MHACVVQPQGGRGMEAITHRRRHETAACTGRGSRSEEAHLLQEQLQAVLLRRLARQLPLRLAGARHLVPGKTQGQRTTFPTDVQWPHQGVHHLALW